MATSEIDKLERRYAENPHGLTFAPLAEVHRKNGDVARALELLRIGLELHPNYIPASIVLGRCHQDLGDLPAAEAAFAHVLRLDDENVIALKSLADMNERQGRLDEAERWLRRLVSVDRSNDEARQQLERIEAAQAEAAAREGTRAATPTSPAPDIAVSAATAEPAAPVAHVPEQPSEPAEAPSLELMDDVGAAVAERMAEPAARLETSSPAGPKEPSVQQPEPLAAPEAAPLAGLESSEFEPPKVSPSVQSPLGLEIETESEVVLNSSGASEFSVPDASQDLAALAAKMNASRPRNPGRRASDAPRAEVTKSPPVPKPAAEATPPVPPPAASPQPVAKVYTADSTKGQSVAAFFHSLLSARPPENTGARISPLHPSPASPNGETPPANGSDGQEGVVSFDDFFGAAAGGSSRETAGGEPGKDDLDQFHSWLQNLKR